MCKLFGEGLETTWDADAEEQTSGSLCSYHPIKNTINTHVIWCPLVGQQNTATFCFVLTQLASLISSGVK